MPKKRPKNLEFVIPFYTAVGGYGLSVLAHLAGLLGVDILTWGSVGISLLGIFCMIGAVLALLGTLLSFGRSVDRGLDLGRIYFPFQKYPEFDWAENIPRWLRWIAWGSFFYAVLNFIMAAFMMTIMDRDPNILQVFSGGALMFYGVAMANLNPFPPKMRKRDPARHKKRGG